MNWLQSAWNWAFPTGSQDGDNLRTGKITTERAGDSHASVEANAIGLSATWACVNFWAGNIAGLPLTVYRRGPLGVAVEAREHPLFWILHDSPNYDQSAYDFWEFMCACIELHGNAYAEIARRDDGMIVSLTPIRPELVTVRRLSTGELEYRWYDGSSLTIAKQAQILHIRGFGGGPLGGLSPLSVCRRSFATALATDQAAGTMFSNGVMTSGAFVSKRARPLDAAQMKLAQEIITEKYTGARNAGRPLVLNSDMAFEALGINPDDAQMLESRNFSVADVCRVFEVDPHLVGHTTGNTMLGSSIGDQTLSLLKFKMRKRLKRIEGALEKQLLSRADRNAGVSIEFNVEGFLRADSAGRAAYYHIMKQFMTKNEIRALEGLAPVEGGDVMFAQMQDIPLADAIAGATEKAA